jgi:protein TonB
MPVYASTPGFADRRRHPRALMLIVGAHAVLIAAVMTAKMDLPDKFIPDITRVKLIPSDPPPPDPLPPPPKPQKSLPKQSQLDRPEPIIPIPISDGSTIDTTPIQIPPGLDMTIGSGVEPTPPTPVLTPIRVGPRFATPEWLIKPDYPNDKRRLEEEAVLRLKLSIDERGRVVAVEPVGRADRSFFEAARAHLIRSWRYNPATEDGRPVASSTVITLTFRLE